MKTVHTGRCTMKEDVETIIKLSRDEKPKLFVYGDNACLLLL